MWRVTASNGRGDRVHEVSGETREDREVESRGGWKVAERPFTVSAHERSRIDGCTSLSRSLASLLAPGSVPFPPFCPRSATLSLAHAGSASVAPPRRSPRGVSLCRRARCIECVHPCVSLRLPSRHTRTHTHTRPARTPLTRDLSSSLRLPPSVTLALSLSRPTTQWDTRANVHMHVHTSCPVFRRPSSRNLFLLGLRGSRMLPGRGRGGGCSRP